MGLRSTFSENRSFEYFENMSIPIRNPMEVYAEYLFGPINYQVPGTVQCAELMLNVVTEVKAPFYTVLYEQEKYFCPLSNFPKRDVNEQSVTVYQIPRQWENIGIRCINRPWNLPSAGGRFKKLKPNSKLGRPLSKHPRRNC